MATIKSHRIRRGGISQRKKHLLEQNVPCSVYISVVCTPAVFAHDRQPLVIRPLGRKRYLPTPLSGEYNHSPTTIPPRTSKTGSSPVTERLIITLKCEVNRNFSFFCYFRIFSVANNKVLAVLRSSLVFVQKGDIQWVHTQCRCLEITL